MFGIYFTQSANLSSYEAMLACDSKAYAEFFHGMLKRGVYLAPSAFEAGFISSAHTAEDIHHTLLAARVTLSEMKQGVAQYEQV